MKGHLVERRGKRGSVWYLIYDEPKERGAPRKQHRERLGAVSKKQALAMQRKALIPIDEKTWVKERRDLTVEGFVTAWLEAVKYDLSPNTHVRYTGLMKQHVIPRIGKMQLSRVTSQHLTQIYKAVREQGLSPQTALHVHRAIHTALNYAVKVTKDLRENAASRLKAPKVERRVNTLITTARVAAVLNAAKGTRLEAPVTLAVLTGLRRGELLALKWRCCILDGDAPSLYVAEAVEQARKSSIRFKDPKSLSSRRVIPLAPEAVALLKAHRESQDRVKEEAAGAYGDSDLVFPNPDGRVWPPDSFSVQFGRLASAVAECQGFRLHDLRHAFATLTLADGVSIREVSDLLGHSSKALTLSTYAHAIPGASRAAMGNLAKRLLQAEVAGSA